MPRLLAYRGESLYREIELTGRTVRIGRGSDNDLVLEDVGKSVSRNHAEIRYENGRYVLVDRESQNGVWVSGSRLPQVLLEPNVVASVGPYRLTLDSIDTTAASDSGLTDVSPVSRETLVTSLPKPPKVPPSKGPVQAPSKAQKKPAPSWVGGQPMWVLAALGGLAVGVVVLAIVLFVGGQSEPTPPVVDQFAGMEERIKSGDCAAVLTDLQAILATNPTEPRALELKSRAEACQTAALPPTPPVVPTLEERLKTAAVMVESGDCLGALSQHINPALEIDPLNVEATELKKKAETCGQPPPPQLPLPTAANQPTKTLPPDQGGLTRLPGENEKNYQSRVAVMKDRYAEAEAALAAADYPRAVTLFDGILRDTGPQYMNVMDRLAEAKGRSKEAAQKNIQAARDLEKKGEWADAAEAYRRARLMDNSVNVDADIKRITGMRISEGRKICDEANARYSYSRTAEALQLYQEAVKLLPENDPCVVTARERFPSLRR